MKKLLPLFFCFLSFQSYSQFGDMWYYENEYLRFGNVQESWDTMRGTMRDVSMKCEIKSCYTQIEMTMILDAVNTSYTAKDSLEAQMRFKLPQNAIVTDLYLWVGNEKVKAGIYESQEATQVYESIVNRRKDPAFLRKYYGSYYDLRIFPVMINMPRKVLISYIIPLTYRRNGEVAIPLPNNVLNLSDNPLSNINVELICSQEYGVPVLFENSSKNFDSALLQSGKKSYKLKIDNVSTLNSLNLITKNIQNKDVRIETFLPKNSKENYYFSSFLPPDSFKVVKPLKVLFLFDLVESTSTISGESPLVDLEKMIRSNLTAKDSFNIFYTQTDIKQIDKKMLPAENTSINNAFDYLKNKVPYISSDLKTLLVKGIEYAQANDAQIVLISSSSGYEYYNDANYLIDLVKSKTAKKKVKIDCIYMYDIYNYYSDYYYFSAGNSYLFQNICRYTNGDYFNSSEYSYPEALQYCFKGLYNTFSDIDLYYSLKNGFTFSNYMISDKPDVFPVDLPLNTIGKFKGDYPFLLKFATDIDVQKSFASLNYEIPENEIAESDSVLRTIWSAKYIENLLSEEQTNSVVSEIIEISLRERILTEYTAFLALEPGMNYQEILDNTQNGGESVVGPGRDGDFAIENVNQIELKVQNVICSPNPTKENTFLTYVLNETELVTIDIYNIEGQKVSTISSGKKGPGEHSILLNTNELAQGIYIIELKTESGFTKKVKLIKN